VQLLSEPEGALDEDPSGEAAPKTWADRRFWPALAGITALGLGWRIAYVLAFTRHENARLYDAAWYELQSLTLANGHFFWVPFEPWPDAAHPPLTSLAITPVTWLFGLHDAATPQRLTMAVLGGAVLVVVGLLGRAVAGARVGLLAALIGAAYPNFWMPNGIVMSETLTMLAVGLVLLATYRLLRAPTWGAAVALGLCCGLAMLARAELALLVPFVLVPATLVVRAGWKRRLGLLGVVLLATLVVAGPWIGRNLTAFGDTTLLSTGEGPVLAGANCPATYAGPQLGSWNLTCSMPVPTSTDQSVVSARQSAAGLRYVRHHLGRLPIVVLARVGRVWDLYEPIEMAHTDVGEGRPVPASLAGLYSYYVLMAAGIVGVVVLRKRKIRVWPLLVVAGLVTVVAATSYGLVRFRAEFEVALVVLAAAGVDGLWRRVRHAPAPAVSPDLR